MWGLKKNKLNPSELDYHLYNSPISALKYCVMSKLFLFFTFFRGGGVFVSSGSTQLLGLNKKKMLDVISNGFLFLFYSTITLQFIYCSLHCFILNPFLLLLLLFPSFFFWWFVAHPPWLVFCCMWSLLCGLIICSWCDCITPYHQ